MECWKRIKGYEGHYQISNTGKIKSLDRFVFSKYNNKTTKRKELGRIMSTRIDRCGYETIRLALNGTRKNFSVHRLLAEHFIDNPNNYKQVNHINGIKNDNRLENMEWCSNSQNQIHANKNKLRKANFKRNTVIPKEELLATIGDFKARKKIAEKYSVSVETIRRRSLIGFVGN